MRRRSAQELAPAVKAAFRVSRLRRLPRQPRRRWLPVAPRASACASPPPISQRVDVALCRRTHPGPRTRSYQTPTVTTGRTARSENHSTCLLRTTQHRPLRPRRIWERETRALPKHPTQAHRRLPPLHRRRTSHFHTALARPPTISRTCRAPAGFHRERQPAGLTFPRRKELTPPFTLARPLPHQLRRRPSPPHQTCRPARPTASLPHSPPAHDTL